MAYLLVLLTITAVLGAWVGLPLALGFFVFRRVRKRLQAANGGRSPALLPASTRKGCPAKEKETLRKMERRLIAAHQQCMEALDTRLTSELARARIAPPMEEAYQQINGEIESIYAFCERNDLVGTLKKANASEAAKDIYFEAYQRDLAKVQEAIQKTEEVLSAYERTVATLEVSSSEMDIGSDFDDSIRMLRDLRNELPRYNLEDKVY